MGFVLVLIVLIAALAGINAWFLATGTGGPLNAVAVAVCVGGAIYVTALAVKQL